MKNKKGFSIVELIMYLGLSSILLVSVSVFAVKIIEMRERTKIISEVESQGQFIMQTIARNIRNAEDIIYPLSGTSSSTLSLDVIDVASDPTVFSFDESSIVMKEGSGNLININNNLVAVSNLSFSNLSYSAESDIIKIQFELTFNIADSNRLPFYYTKRFYDSFSRR